VSRLRLNVWSPLPPSPSGIADYAAEQLPLLARECELTAVVEDPRRTAPIGGVRLASPEDAGHADVDLYQLGNSPAHGYVYRAALSRPGVVLLHDWCLHHLVLRETVERGDLDAYLREMRHAHGARGTFVGRQVARALGGRMLPALHDLNQRVLERALAVVALSRDLAARAAGRVPGRPTLHLPHHLSLPLDPPPARADARRALGLPLDVPLVVAPGLATPSKRLDVALRAVARLRAAHPGLRLLVAGAVDPALPLHDWARELGLDEALIVSGRLSLDDFERALAAADVVLALRFPSHGEMSGAVVRALGVGRAVVVSAGSTPAEEFGEGLLAWVDPGAREDESLCATLGHLLAHAELRARLEDAARAHVRRECALEATAARLLAFLSEVAAARPALEQATDPWRVPAGGLQEYLVDEARWAAQELGLAALPEGVAERARELVAPGSGA
jgi:glycosyltransferase involved in cell wall biosynthesis